MTARRLEVEVTLAGLRSGPCGWGTRLRQRDGHRNGLLGLDVHGSAPTVNTSPTLAWHLRRKDCSEPDIEWGHGNSTWASLP